VKLGHVEVQRHLIDSNADTVFGCEAKALASGGEPLWEALRDRVDGANLMRSRDGANLALKG